MSEKQETAEQAADALTPEEEAYFESGGEKEVEAEVETAETETEESEQAAEETETEKPSEEEREEKSKTVPHQALHAEREKRKAIESEVQDLREFRARMEERWKLLEKNQEKPEEKEETPPDPNEDIFAFSQWQAKQLEKLNNKISEREQQEQQHQQQSQQEQAVWGYWESDAQRYAQENPDFPNAAKWLAETRDKQLQAMSAADPRFSDPRARTEQINAELRQIVSSAAQQRSSAAEAVYKIAESYGYQKQQGQAQETNEVTEKVQRLEKAQNASKTVGQASGRSGGDEITPESVASMSEDEFNRWVSVPENARRFEKMMGG